MSKWNNKIWHTLPAILVTLCTLCVICLSPSEVLSNPQAVNSQPSLQDQAILKAIADSHVIPAEQATLQEQAAALQDHASEQEQTNVQEQSITQEIDPTKPASFLFDPLLDNGMVDKNDKDEKKDLALTAIFIDKSRKIAVINGVLLKEGEVIAGKQVKEITSNAVKLIEKTEILELKLPNFSIKREAS